MSERTTTVITHPRTVGGPLEKSRPIIGDSLSENSFTDTERWLRSLGTRFCAVKILGKDGAWVDENHVEDPDTFLITVDMSLKRLDARYAVWVEDEQEGRYCLLDRRTGDCRSYPSREAAEMVAIHGG